MTEKYRITYDADKENAFIMQTDDRTIKFSRTPEVLCTYKPSSSYLKQVAETKFMSPPTEISAAQLVSMVSTVTDNCRVYTQRQFFKYKKSNPTLSYRFMTNS